MVHTNAHSCSVLAADIQERNEAVLNLLEFSCILLVSILQLLELTGGIHIVTRIDAHLLTITGSDIGHSRIEMHVGYKRNVTAGSPHALTDHPHILGFPHALCRQPYQFSASSSNGQNLLHATFGIHGARGAHGLHADGIVTANADVPDSHFVGLSSLHETLYLKLYT